MGWRRAPTVRDARHLRERRGDARRLRRGGRRAREPAASSRVGLTRARSISSPPLLRASCACRMCNKQKKSERSHTFGDYCSRREDALFLQQVEKAMGRADAITWVELHEAVDALALRSASSTRGVDDDTSSHSRERFCGQRGTASARWREASTRSSAREEFKI